MIYQKKMSIKQYHTEIKPIMMIPSLKYLVINVILPMNPEEIVFSHWEYLPTNKRLSLGVKMYYTLPNDETEKEYYVIVSQIKYGAFAGSNNLKFYKDYGNIAEY